MVKQFSGKWKFVDSEKFKEYMQEVGMKGSFQVAASFAKSNLIVTQDNEIISVKAESTFKMYKIELKLNEEFDEKTPDSRKSKFFQRDDKLIQEQHRDGKITTLEREIKNGKLEVVKQKLDWAEREAQPGDKW